jgi:hypothetical protein
MYIERIKTTGAPYRVSQVAHCFNYAWTKELLLGNHRLLNAGLKISGSSEEAAIGSRGFRKPGNPCVLKSSKTAPSCSAVSF